MDSHSHKIESANASYEAAVSAERGGNIEDAFVKYNSAFSEYMECLKDEKDEERISDLKSKITAVLSNAERLQSQLEKQTSIAPIASPSTKPKQESSQKGNRRSSIMRVMSYFSASPKDDAAVAQESGKVPKHQTDLDDDRMETKSMAANVSAKANDADAVVHSHHDNHSGHDFAKLPEDIDEALNRLRNSLAEATPRILAAENERDLVADELSLLKSVMDEQLQHITRLTKGDLRAQLTVAEKQLTSSQLSHRGTLAELEVAKSKIVSLSADKAELDAAKSKIVSLTAEKALREASLIQQLAEAEAKLKERTGEFQKTISELKDAQAKLTTQDTAGAKADSEVQLLRNQILLSETQLETSAKELADEKAAHAQAAQEASSLKGRLFEAEGKLRVSQAMLQSTVAELTHSLSDHSALEEKAASQIFATDEKLKTVEAELVTARKQLAELVTTQSELTTAREQLAELATTQSELTTARKQLAELASTQSELATARKQLAESATIHAELATTHAELATAKKQLAESATIQAELGAARKQLAESATMQSELATARKQLAESATIQLELATARKQLAESATIQSELATARKQLAESATIQSELATARKQLAESATMHVELTASRKQLSSAEARLLQLEARLSSLQADLEAKSAELVATRQQLLDLSTQGTQGRAHHTEPKAQTHTREEDGGAGAGDDGDGHGDVDSDSDSVAAEVAQQRAIAALRARLTVSEMDCRRAVEEKQAALAQLTVAQAALEDLTEERDAMRAAIEELQGANARAPPPSINGTEIFTAVGTDHCDDASAFTSAFHSELRGSRDNYTLVGTENFDEDISAFYGDQRALRLEDAQARLAVQLAEMTSHRDVLQAEVEALRAAEAALAGLQEGLRGSGLLSVEELLAERDGMKLELKKLQAKVALTSHRPPGDASEAQCLFSIDKIFSF